MEKHHQSMFLWFVMGRLRVGHFSVECSVWWSFHHFDAQLNIQSIIRWMNFVKTFIWSNSVAVLMFPLAPPWGWHLWFLGKYLNNYWTECHELWSRPLIIWFISKYLQTIHVPISFSYCLVLISMQTHWNLRLPSNASWKLLGFPSFQSKCVPGQQR